MPNDNSVKPASEEPLIAVFVDFENRGDRRARYEVGKFQIQLVLKRLLGKGRIVFKRAYCDWSRYDDSVREFHAQGVELIDIPQSKMSGKNSADIRMVVDALDLCYSKQHIDMFALISGDSDFSPLVSKLKENNKRVIGCGVKSSTSDLLIANCDEFIYYNDLIRVAKRAPARAARKKAEPLRKKGAAAEETDQGRQEARGHRPSARSVALASSRITTRSGARCLKPRSAACSPASTRAITATAAFRTLLEDMKARGLIELEYDESRGNYKVRRAKD